LHKACKLRIIGWFAVVNRRKSFKPAQPNQWSHESVPHRYIIWKKEKTWTINTVEEYRQGVFMRGFAKWDERASALEE
jgi:hypothetical protein